MKDQLGGKIMTEFAALKPKTYSYSPEPNCRGWGGGGGGVLKVLFLINGSCV